MKKKADAPKGKAGRPPGPVKLNPDLQARLCQALELGLYIEQACTFVGISWFTYFHWRKLAERTPLRQSDQVYREFVTAVDLASVRAEAGALKKVREAQFGWQAHMCFLERRWRDRWSRVSANTVSISQTASTDANGSATQQFVVQFVEPGDPSVNVTGEEE